MTTNPDQSVREQLRIQVRRLLNDAFDYGTLFDENWAEEEGGKNIEDINVSLDLTAAKILTLLDQIRAERVKATQKADVKAFVEIVGSLEKIVASNDGRDYSRRVDDIRQALEVARSSALKEES